MIPFFSKITILGDVEVILALTFFVTLFLIFRKRFRYLMPFIILLATSEATIFILKHVIARPRPLDPLVPIDDPYSFPSGHANIGIVFYVALAFLINKEYVTSPVGKRLVWGAAFLVALLVGISRIVLRAHHIEDVVAGYALGVFWLYATWRVFLRKPSR